MTLPTDPRKPRFTPATIALFAVLVVAAMQLGGFIHSAAKSGQRDRQISHLQTQLDGTQAQLTEAQTQLTEALTALATVQATNLDLRRGLAALARQKHITTTDIRRLEQRTKPRTVVVPTPLPGPTVTVTKTARPPAPHPPRHHRPTPTPGCTYFMVKTGRCLPTIPPVSPIPLPTLRF